MEKDWSGYLLCSKRQKNSSEVHVLSLCLSLVLFLSSICLWIWNIEIDLTFLLFFFSSFFGLCFFFPSAVFQLWVADWFSLLISFSVPLGQGIIAESPDKCILVPYLYSSWCHFAWNRAYLRTCNIISWIKRSLTQLAIVVTSRDLERSVWHSKEECSGISWTPLCHLK